MARILAVGKESVLGYLETCAMKQAGQPGAYLVFGSGDTPELVIIAGQTFSGNFSTNSSTTFPPGKLKVENGIVVSFEEE